MPMQPTPPVERARSIALVGFDADDTLWRSEDYYRQAQAEFEAIVARHVDLDDVHERLYAIESRNIALFGYGAKGMTLSMLEAAYAITGGRISSAELHRIVGIGKEILAHPVDLLPGIRDAVAAIGATWPLVLVTKGDLFHQEAKVRQSGLADLFPRIEIVSEKDPATYARVLAEFGVAPGRFAMVGNSLRSDVAPVLELGGWAVHMPYHVTWAHEALAAVPQDLQARMRRVGDPAGLEAALRDIDRAARDAG